MLGFPGERFFQLADLFFKRIYFLFLLYHIKRQLFDLFKQRRVGASQVDTSSLHTIGRREIGQMMMSLNKMRHAVQRGKPITLAKNKVRPIIVGLYASGGEDSRSVHRQ